MTTETIETHPEVKRPWFDIHVARSMSNIAFYALIGFSFLPASWGNFAAGCYVLLFALFIRYAILEFNIAPKN